MIPPQLNRARSQTAGIEQVASAGIAKLITTFLLHRLQYGITNLIEMWEQYIGSPT